MLKSKRVHLNILIIVFFIILSILNVAILFHFKVYMLHNEDMSWHWQRIAELVKGNQLFPLFANNSFSYNGSAVMTMYPYLFLYPFAFIFKITKSVALTSRLMYLINTFLVLLISYYSSLQISHKKSSSYLFAMLYSISSYLFVYEENIHDVGMLYWYIFMPLVIFGFILLIVGIQWGYLITLSSY